MDMEKAIKILKQRDFQVEDVSKLKYKIYDLDSEFYFETEGELINYAKDQEMELY